MRRTTAMLAGLLLLAALPQCPSAACVTYSTFAHSVGAIGTGSTGLDLAISGSYAFASLAPARIAVFSLADPVTPVEVASITMSESVLRLRVAGTRLYAVGWEHLFILDIAHPTNPTLLGTLTLAGGAGSDIEPAGNLAYVVAGNGLLVVDVQNAAAPVVLTTYSQFTGLPTGIARKGNYLYVGSDRGLKQSADLEVVGISDSVHPVHVTTVASVLGSGWGSGWRLSADGDKLAISEIGLVVLDITNPAAPLAGGSFMSTNFAAFVLRAGRLYVGDAATLSFEELQGTNPVTKGSLALEHDAAATALSGPYLYVLEGTGVNPIGGLEVIDVTDPRTAPRFGTLDTPGDSRGVAISGTRGYVADGNFGLRVVNLANEQIPSLLGSVDTPGFLGDVAVAGAHAYGADGGGGLRVFDVTNPAAPTIVGAVGLTGFATRVALSGSYALIACDSGGLAVVDASNPTAPQLVASRATSALAYDVKVLGTHAFVVGGTGVSNGPGFLQSFDISNPTDPLARGTVPLAHGASGLAIADGHAYVACGDQSTGRVEVVDLSNPESPLLVATSPLDFTPRSVAAENEVVFVGGTNATSPRGQIAVFDLHASATAPSRIAALVAGNPVDSFYGLAVGSGLLAGVSNTGALALFPSECAGATSVPPGEVHGGALSLGPNPTRGSAVVRFSSPENTTVRISVF